MPLLRRRDVRRDGGSNQVKHVATLVSLAMIVAGVILTIWDMTKER